MLNKSGPSIDPCGTPLNMSDQVIKDVLILVLWPTFTQVT